MIGIFHNYVSLPEGNYVEELVISTPNKQVSRDHAKPHWPARTSLSQDEAIWANCNLDLFEDPFKMEHPGPTNGKPKYAHQTPILRPCNWAKSPFLMVHSPCLNNNS